ncbi:MAG: ABC transporter permease [Cyclobacteriaceae bacterium]|nr:ABC transporter permease [Cyclobacteriaceae bacterium]
MIKNYLLITLRSLAKNKLFIFINVFGMGIAIACCIVAYVNWEYAAKWDSTQLNGKHIYRVQFNREFQGKSERFGTAPMALANYIKQNFSEVSKVVRYQTAYSDMRIGEEVFGTQMIFADSAFFELFTYELKYGSYNAFYDKGKVLVSDETARKYFNKEDVVGESLTQIVLGSDGVRRPKEYIIGGVFKKLPRNSSLQFEVITLFDNFWDINLDNDQHETSWKRWTTLFLLIQDPASVASVTKQLQNYIEPQNLAREDFKITSYYLENFDGMMKRNRANPRVNNDWTWGTIPDEAVTVPAIMAGLLLLLACFNFTNTSISISSRRLKEIGIRKVMGGMRSQLVFQFLGENLFLCIMGLIAGLLLAELLVPAYDSLWSWLELSLSYSDNMEFLIFLFGLLLVTALIAGGYPSFYITSFEPVSILKGTARFGGTNWFTRILLGGQFVISLLCIIMGIAFYQNSEYQKNYDLGFATSGAISVWVNNEGGFNTYRDAISGNKDIELIAGTKDHIANAWYNDPVKYESVEREVDILDIGDNYFEAMDMKLLAGRNFIKDSETDRKESVLVTEELVKQFGWTDNPIGKRLVWMDTVQLYVVGVVKNIYARALWMPIQPLMIRYTSPAQYKQLLIKTEPAKLADVNDYMEEKWKAVFPNTVYNGQMIDQEMQETNDINKNIMTMCGFLGFFAALMTGIGMYTLVSLNVVKKMKEIGVRKVLGASVLNIARVINLEFAINLFVATLLGGGIGYFMADTLMDSIWEYYLKLGIITLVVSVLAMVMLAFISVGYKTITTASLNPTRTLRSE